MCCNIFAIFNMFNVANVRLNDFLFIHGILPLQSNIIIHSKYDVMMLDICDKAKTNSSFGVKQQSLTYSLLDI